MYMQSTCESTCESEISSIGLSDMATFHSRFWHGGRATVTGTPGRHAGTRKDGEGDGVLGHAYEIHRPFVGISPHVLSADSQQEIARLQAGQVRWPTTVHLVEILQRRRIISHTDLSKKNNWK